MSSADLAALQSYSACDVADALLQLEPEPEPQRQQAQAQAQGQGRGGHHLAGFLDGILPRRRRRRRIKDGREVIVGPAFTVQFRPKGDQAEGAAAASEKLIPPGRQWSDMVPPGSVVVVQQPPGQRCAAVGGHHARRIAMLGAKALVVCGRVRDVGEMDEELDGLLSVWAAGTSVVGAGAECRPHAVQVPLCLDGVLVSPDDVVVCDEAEEGVVRIPRAQLGAVLEFLRRHAESEAKVKRMILEGHSVQEAFDKCR